MKKVLSAFLLGFILLTPQYVEAIDLGRDLASKAATQGGFDKNTDEKTFAATLGQVVKAALSFAGIIFMSLTIYAGFLWMTARGEDEQINRAQKILRSSVIGLVIAVASYSITAFVVARLIGGTIAGSP